jgi:hypothetical protein
MTEPSDAPTTGRRRTEAITPDPTAPDSEVDADTARPRRTKTLRLPFVTAIVEIPNLPRGRREPAATVRSLLPSTEQVLFYGGVAALAAFEIIEWPVAAVVAAGTYVAQRADRDRTGEPRYLAARDEDVRPAAAPA